MQIHHRVSSVVYQRTLRHIMYLRTQPEVSYLRSIHRDQASAKMPFSAGYFDIFLFAVSSLFRLKFFLSFCHSSDCLLYHMYCFLIFSSHLLIQPRKIRKLSLRNQDPVKYSTESQPEKSDPLPDVVQLISVQYVTERPVLHGAGVATIERVLVYFQPKEGHVMNVLWDQATNKFTENSTVDRLIETGDSEHNFKKAIMEQGRGQERHETFRGLEKKLLHTVGYNKNVESEGIKQDGELMNASEIGATNGKKVEEFQKSFFAHRVNISI
ncbi:BnaA09g18550D [Brassica napus]|uniref:BnaA09g18550D protein n=1 Tax=Brassica napus TaxID=3708 RepID=A0A078HTS0_BRANA|nr:BnaA09g18550D [Brassica napus]